MRIARAHARRPNLTLTNIAFCADSLAHCARSCAQNYVTIFENTLKHSRKCKFKVCAHSENSQKITVQTLCARVKHAETYWNQPRFTFLGAGTNLARTRKTRRGKERRAAKQAQRDDPTACFASARKVCTCSQKREDTLLLTLCY